MLERSELTYGEVRFHHCIATLEYVKPQPGEIFIDLGCGAGRPVFSAALAFPQLAVCKGLELLEQLTSMAQEISGKVLAECERRQMACAPIEIN